MKKNLVFDGEIKNLPGFHKVARLQGEILKETLSNPFVSSCDESIARAKEIGGAAWGFFEIGCSEYEQLQRAVYEADRIEGEVSLDGIKGKTFELEVKFYIESEIEPFLALWFDVDPNEAVIVDCGYSG